MHDFDRLAPYYDLVLSLLLLPFGGRQSFRRSAAQFFLQSVRLPENAVVADLGCGTGDFIQYLPESFEIHCYDSSASMLGRAQSKFTRQSSRKIRYFNKQVEEIDACSPCYDAVIMSLLLHELSPPLIATTLNRATSILKPGGYLFISDFTRPTGTISHYLFRLLRFIEPPQAIENIINVLPVELSRLELEFVSSRKFIAGMIDARIYRKEQY